MVAVAPARRRRRTERRFVRLLLGLALLALMLGTGGWHPPTAADPATAGATTTVAHPAAAHAADRAVTVTDQAASAPATGGSAEFAATASRRQAGADDGLTDQAARSALGQRAPPLPA